RAMLDFAEATKNSAKRELSEAEDAYRSAVEAMQQKKTAEDSKKDSGKSATSLAKSAEREDKNADWRDNIPKPRDENNEDKDIKEGWEIDTFGYDPADEEMGDEGIEILYCEEGESENGADDESTVGGSETQDGDPSDENEAASDDETETANDGTWGQGTGAGQAMTFPHRPRPDNDSPSRSETGADYEAQLQSLLIRRAKKGSGGGQTSARRAGTEPQDPARHFPESRRRKGEISTNRIGDPQGGRR
ncbi:MAG: hypothetical protein IJ521_12880, partial [Schwartzia sp.]|nr:hypothetical protein [Schwartzia sp. (in: firmicutes)]